MLDAGCWIEANGCLPSGWVENPKSEPAGGCCDGSGLI